MKLGRIAGFLLLCAAISLVSHLLAPKSPQPEDKLSVHFIDVGQGDCTFLTSGGETMLIDCGEAVESKKVMAYLEECGVKRLDYVIDTHPHSDHMGGMTDIIDAFDVGEFIIPHLDDDDVPAAYYFTGFLEAIDRRGVKLSEAELYREIDLGDARCEIIAPVESGAGNINNYSVCLIVRHGDNTFLFTGDAEVESEQLMLQSGHLVHADVYKVGHHGSSTSSTEAFLKAVTPEIAVISCGYGNPYGHPKDSVISRLARYTKTIYRTDLYGSIVIRSDGSELTAGTEK